ncbi:MAG: hypothetical protein IKY94_15135 [Lachnospiraceae bacterium]|nr:hypothetical protein [Lachnospiraceae bacterium]
MGWKDLKINEQILTITRDKFVDLGILNQTYKVVIFYEDYKASNTIELYLSDTDMSNYILDIKYSADGRTANLEVVPNPGSEYYAAWLKEDENGVIFNLDNTDFILENINIANINGVHKYFCSIISKESNQVITTVSREVYNLI